MIVLWAQAWQSQPPRQDPCPKRYFQPLLRDLLRCFRAVNVCLSCCLLNMHYMPERYSFYLILQQCSEVISLVIGLCFCQSLASQSIVCYFQACLHSPPTSLTLHVLFSSCILWRHVQWCWGYKLEGIWLSNHISEDSHCSVTRILDFKGAKINLYCVKPMRFFRVYL